MNNGTKTTEDLIHPTDVLLMTQTQSHLNFESIAVGRRIDILHGAFPQSAEQNAFFLKNQADITLSKLTHNLDENNLLQSNRRRACAS